MKHKRALRVVFAVVLVLGVAWLAFSCATVLKVNPITDYVNRFSGTAQEYVAFYQAAKKNPPEVASESFRMGKTFIVFISPINAWGSAIPSRIGEKLYSGWEDTFFGGWWAMRRLEDAANKSPAVAWLNFEIPERLRAPGPDTMDTVAIVSAPVVLGTTEHDVLLLTIVDVRTKRVLLWDKQFIERSGPPYLDATRQPSTDPMRKLLDYIIEHARE